MLSHPQTTRPIMASFLLPRKQFLCFILIISLCFTFYTFKWQLRTESNTALTCDHMAINVAFIKTHKTASTSVSHLFLRYANKYHRLFTYFKDPLYFTIKKFYKNSLLDLKPGYNYSVFADHTIFDYEEMRAVLPDDTTAYITILRDPVAQFQSAYDYYSMESIKGINITAVANLNISNPDEANLIKHHVGLFGRIGRNQMAFDLGLDPSLFDNETAILEKVRELDGQLDLVMITEMFDQSVILMKEKLCWKDTNDVISFKINARSKAESKTQLSSEQKENLRRMNRADQLIYDHFHEKMLREIDAFGKEKMEEEVRKLRRATEDMYELCVDEEATLKENQNMDVVLSFKLKQEAESHSVCGEITASYFPLWTSLFPKQKAFFAENELVLGLRELLLVGTINALFIWRTLQSFLVRHHIIVSQLFLSSPSAFSPEPTHEPS